MLSERDVVSERKEGRQDVDCYVVRVSGKRVCLSFSFRAYTHSLCMCPYDSPSLLQPFAASTVFPPAIPCYTLLPRLLLWLGHPLFHCVGQIGGKKLKQAMQSSTRGTEACVPFTNFISAHTHGLECAYRCAIVKLLGRAVNKDPCPVRNVNTTQRTQLHPPRGTHEPTLEQRIKHDNRQSLESLRSCSTHHIGATGYTQRMTMYNSKHPPCCSSSTIHPSTERSRPTLID